MGREFKQILAIAAGAVVVVLVAMALMGGSQTVEVFSPVDLPEPGEFTPAGTPTAVVVRLYEEQETSLFGLRKGETHYFASVQLYGPSKCTGLITYGDPWPVSNPECSTEVPIVGTVTGVGIAPTGEAHIVVDTVVSAECFNSIDRGSWWPSDASGCDS